MTGEETKNGSNKDYGSKSPHVVIVGGGPSGAAAAKAMADRGYTNIDVYKAYPYPKSISKKSSMAYAIALSPRGLQGIADLTGLDLIKEAPEGGGGGVVLLDMVQHAHNPKTKKTSTRAVNHKGRPFLIVPREDLAGRLLDAAAKEESGARVHFQHRLADIDFENRVAKFTTIDPKKNGEEETVVKGVKYDLPIGANGFKEKGLEPDG